MLSSIQPATAVELAQLRRQLTGRGRDIANERVLRAMERVPRHAFVPAHLRAEAYDDRPLPIGFDQTISQPFIVAFMTAAIDPQPGDRVLEVGTGCGYQTAVLAELAGEVYSIEIVESLARRATETLARLGCRNAHVRHGDGWHGWPEHSPFDAILVTCSPGLIPSALIDQLRPGGRMIIPIGSLHAGQELWLIEKTTDGIHRDAVLPVRFVPMTGQAETL